MSTIINDELPLAEGETATSWFSRITAFYGAPSAMIFAADLGLNYQDLCMGRNGQIEALAKVTGAPVDNLLRNSPVLVGKGVYRLFGQNLAIAYSPRSAYRVCPKCALEAIEANRSLNPDAAVYSRAIWLIRSIEKCTKHRCRLVSVPLAKKRKYTHHDFAYLAGEASCHLGELVHDTGELPFSPLEEYILGRIEGRNSGVPFVDDLPLSALEGACLTMGAVSAFGPEARIKYLQPNEVSRARQAGFEILSEGPSGVAGLVDRLHHQAVQRPLNQYTPRVCLGVFYDWLEFYAQDPSFFPIKKAAADRVVETMPIATGDTVFGIVNPARRYHSIRSGATDYRLRIDVMERIAKAAGLFEPSTDIRDERNVLISAVRADPILADPDDLLPPREARRHLGVSLQVFNGFVAAGFVQPVFRDPAYQSKFGALYRRSEIDRTFNEILTGQDLTTVDDTMMSLPELVKALVLPYGELVKLIIDGRFSWLGRNRSLPIFQGTFVLAAEAGPLRRTAQVKEFIDQAQVCKLLGMADLTVQRLIEAGYLPNRTSPAIGNPRMFFEADLGNFRAKFVTAGMIARSTNEPIRSVAYRLDRAGLHPFLSRDKFGANVYLRSDVVRAGML